MIKSVFVLSYYFTRYCRYLSASLLPNKYLSWRIFQQTSIFPMLIDYIYLCFLYLFFSQYPLEKMGTSIGSWKESFCCWWFEYCSCFYRQVWRGTWLREANVSLLLVFFFCYGSNFKVSVINNTCLLSFFLIKGSGNGWDPCWENMEVPFLMLLDQNTLKGTAMPPGLSNCLSRWFVVWSFSYVLKSNHTCQIEPSL